MGVFDKIKVAALNPLIESFVTEKNLKETNEAIIKILNNYPLSEGEVENIISVINDGKTGKNLIVVFSLNSEKKICRIRDKMELTQFIKQILGITN